MICDIVGGMDIWEIELSVYDGLRIQNKGSGGTNPNLPKQVWPWSIRVVKGAFQKLGS